MKLRIRSTSVVLAILLCAMGCDQKALLEKLTPKADAEYARQYIALFHTRDFAAIEKALDPKLRDGAIMSKLEAIAGTLPNEEPSQVRVIGTNTNTFPDISYIDLTFEYQYSSKWVVANITMQRTSEQRVVTGIHVDSAQDSQEHLNRFTFRGKGPGHYALAVGAAVSAAVMLYALLLVIRAPVVRDRWLWCILPLVGVSQVSFNWTTGEVGLRLISVNVPVISAGKLGPYGPVVIAVSLPLGAMLFLLQRRTLFTRRTRPEPTNDAGPSAPSDRQQAGTEGPR